MIPGQFGGAGALRPILGGISGTAGTGSDSQSFRGIGDTIGSQGVPDVQAFLQGRFPGALILEFVNGKDRGVVPVVIMVPANIPCPCGTTETGRLW